MSKLYYAVKVGLKTGIYETWEECQKQVCGYSGAKFKSFTSEEEAKSFIAGDTEAKNVSYPDDCVFVYVDGSYNINTQEYGMGFVILKKDSILRAGSRKGNNSKYISSRNVAGELGATEAALCVACNEFKAKNIVIYHDYEGIALWANEDWKCNKELTQKYYEFVKKLRADGFNISFVHVKGHSGVYYNELADILARYSLDMTSNSETVKAEALLADEPF